MTNHNSDAENQQVTGRKDSKVPMIRAYALAIFLFLAGALFFMNLFAI